MSAAAAWRQRLGDSLAGVLLLRALAWRPRFDGRATRRELGLTALVCVVALTLLVQLTPAPPPDLPGRPPRDGVYLLHILYGTILAGIPLLAAMVRRLHDSGRDGWTLVMVMVPYIGLVAIAVMLLLNPTPGPNPYGENPRG